MGNERGGRLRRRREEGGLSRRRRGDGGVSCIWGGVLGVAERGLHAELPHAGGVDDGGPVPLVEGDLRLLLLDLRLLGRWHNSEAANSTKAAPVFVFHFRHAHISKLDFIL